MCISACLKGGLVPATAVIGLVRPHAIDTRMKGRQTDAHKSIDHIGGKSISIFHAE